MEAIWKRLWPWHRETYVFNPKRATFSKSGELQVLAAEANEPQPEYELEIVLRDGGKCIAPVRRYLQSESRWDSARGAAEEMARSGGTIEGPRNTFRKLIPADILTVTARERVE